MRPKWRDRQKRYEIGPAVGVQTPTHNQQRNHATSATYPPDAERDMNHIMGCFVVALGIVLLIVWIKAIRS